tara:strand:+ start:509 stop:790 length:282 start_codon:yes stop_codon:yes gene_type:complete
MAKRKNRRKAVEIAVYRLLTEIGQELLIHEIVRIVNDRTIYSVNCNAITKLFTWHIKCGLLIRDQKWDAGLKQYVVTWQIAEDVDLETFQIAN